MGKECIPILVFLFINAHQKRYSILGSIEYIRPLSEVSVKKSIFSSDSLGVISIKYFMCLLANQYHIIPLLAQLEHFFTHLFSDYTVFEHNVMFSNTSLFIRVVHKGSCFKFTLLFIMILSLFLIDNIFRFYLSGLRIYLLNCNIHWLFLTPNNILE